MTMRQMKKFLAAAVFCTALGASQALAASYGFYFEGAGGIGNMDFESMNAIDTDVETLGIGFVADTNATGKKALGLRFDVGLESMDIDFDTGPTLDLDGLAVQAALEIPFKKSGVVRWWFGPLVRLGIYNGDFDGLDGENVDVYTAGAGAALGMNLFPNPSGTFCTAVTVGGRFTGLYAQHDDAVTGETDEGLGWQTTGFLNIAFLWE
jgi:hypothetical protein